MPFEDAKLPHDESSFDSPAVGEKGTLATELGFTASEEKVLVRKLGMRLSWICGILDQRR
jgi:hypothetical protein